MTKVEIIGEDICDFGFRVVEYTPEGQAVGITGLSMPLGKAQELADRMIESGKFTTNKIKIVSSIVPLEI